MKKNWQLFLALALIGASTLLYLIHFLIFRDSHHLWIYLVGDIAFVPLEVLLVTIVIHRLIEQREKRSRLQKMNMVIGGFFSEVGTPLLTRLVPYDIQNQQLAEMLRISGKWVAKDFTRVRQSLTSRTANIKMSREEFTGLSSFLQDKRNFLLHLLANPNLLEHGAFTDVLWAVCHLEEELTARCDFTELPDSDIAHLIGDINRVYGRVQIAWLNYLEHLHVDYPYLFSFAVRTNPFIPDTQIEVS